MLPQPGVRSCEERAPDNSLYVNLYVCVFVCNLCVNKAKHPCQGGSDSLGSLLTATDHNME